MPDRPNIVWIDTHDAGRLFGCCGCEWIRTPAIDRLAAEGARLTNLFATAPICMPSRTSFMTGRMPHEMGVVGQVPIRDTAQVLPRRLREIGYDTVACGRLQLANGYEDLGYNRHIGESGSFSLERAAGEFLRERGPGETPFFLSLSFWEMHRPFGLDYEEELLDVVEVPGWLPDSPTTRKDLAALVRVGRELDRKFGVVLEALERSPHAGRTLVVFLSDHGPALARAKHTLYDSGTAITGIFRWPGVVPEGHLVDALASGVDVYSSILEAAGCEAPPGTRGVSHWSTLCGRDAESRHDAVFSEHTWGRRLGRGYYQPTRAVRDGRFHYIRHYHNRPHYIDSDWLCRYKHQRDYPAQLFGEPVPCEQLFDTEIDPEELVNLAGKDPYAAILNTLSQTLDAFLAESRDPILEGPVSHPGGESDQAQWIPNDRGRYELSSFEPIEAIPEFPFAADTMEPPAGDSN